MMTNVLLSLLLPKVPCIINQFLFCREESVCIAKQQWMRSFYSHRKTECDCY